MSSIHSFLGSFTIAASVDALFFLCPPYIVFFFVRNGSVIADFTITFNDSNFGLIEELNQSISSTGHLYNMPLKLQQLTPKNGKRKDLSLKADLS